MLGSDLAAGEGRRSKVFLSSTYKEVPLGAAQARIFRLRRALFELREEVDVDIWVHEHMSGRQDNLPGWTESVQECLEQLSRSDLLIVLLARRAGEPVEISSELGATPASVFEVELFYASQKCIPVVFFVVRGYEPEDELSNLIRILGLKDGAKNWFEIEEGEVRSEVKRLLMNLSSIPARDWRLRFLPDRLASERSFSDIRKEIESDRLSFIERFRPLGGRVYSEKRFQELMRRSTHATANKASQLGFLWMALRELSIDGWRAERAGEWLEICNRWPSAAAWAGLHGPLYTGVLAAFHTRNDLLRRQGRPPLEDPDFPYGPLASEFYSTALIYETRQWRRCRFEAAVELATRHAARNEKDPSGALAIRASARLRLVRLGKPWLIYSALADYRNVYRTRQRIGATDSAIGEALSEWGFAQLQVRGLVHVGLGSALNKIREGVRLMQSDPNTDRIGFLIRGKRKLAQALLQAGYHDEAAAVSESVEELARSHGVLGQLGRDG